MTAVIIFYLIDPLLVKFKSEFKFEVPSIIPAVIKPISLLAGTIAFKVIIGKILNIRDDVSTVLKNCNFFQLGSTTARTIKDLCFSSIVSF